MHAKPFIFPSSFPSSSCSPLRTHGNRPPPPAAAVGEELGQGGVVARVLGAQQRHPWPLGSYLKPNGMEGRGLDVVGLETIGIEFDSEYTLNSSQFSTFLLCSVHSGGHNFLSWTWNSMILFFSV